MQITTERQAKHRVQELVQGLKKDMGLNTPPFYKDINDPIARKLGIQVVEDPNFLGEGRYFLTNPPKILINPAIGELERLNFTFFHEISHHLIRGDGELYSFLHEHSGSDLTNSLEMYCNIGAAEFLIPSADVSEAIKKQGFSVKLIADLDSVYPASKPAIAIQLAQCASHQCVVVICEYGLMPENQNQRMLAMEVHRQQCLFVQYSSSSPSCKYTTAKYVIIPNNHVIASAYQDKSLVKGRGNVPVRSGKEWPVDCEAFFYKGKVYATFNIMPPPSHDQMTLFDP